MIVWASMALNIVNVKKILNLPYKQKMYNT
ncbi:hypothetical protein QE436_001277 [Pantoea anthophila]|nr:hypothetical protein [Pantoea anthophila]